MRPRPFFAGAGLDRADAVRADSARLAEMAGDALARELVWKDGLPAVGADGALTWRELGSPDLFLGIAGNSPRFSAVQAGLAEGPAAFALVANLDPGDAPLFAAALSLSRWHSRHGFCATCGGSTDLVRGGWSRRCKACSAEHFPRVDPVVIMLAEHQGRLLLGRQHLYSPGRYSALAGFVEVGETIEDAVARELQEEAGISVSDVRYIASQPWPFPSSLMIGCTALVASDELTIDHGELENARWFTREEIAGAVEGGPGSTFDAPPPHTIARTLLKHWLAA